MRHLPPLNALKAFEATARLGGVQRASEELHVTHGAISRQVKLLEDWLGITLFERNQRALQLNQAGKDYLHSISTALDLIHQGTASVQHKSSNILGIATTHSFATKWLMDKLPAFSTLYPQYEVWLSMDQKRTDFVTSRVDVAIRMGKGPWPELHCIGLLKDTLVAVCSPEFLAENKLENPEDLARVTLLHDQDQSIQWHQWFNQFVPRSSAYKKGPRFSSSDILLSAAISGQGVALVSEVLAKDDLNRNNLVNPFEQSIDLGFYYWLVLPKHERPNRRLQHFIDWITGLVDELESS